MKKRTLSASAIVIVIALCMAGCNSQDCIGSLEKKILEINQLNQQVSEHQKMLAQKDQEIEKLKQSLSLAKENTVKAEQSAADAEKNVAALQDEKQDLETQIRKMNTAHDKDRKKLNSTIGSLQKDNKKITQVAKEGIATTIVGVAAFSECEAAYKRLLAENLRLKNMIQQARGY